MLLYADVIVPLPLQGVFTYFVPSDMAAKIEVGSRVIVQFGQKRFYTAIVSNLHEASEKRPDIKEIETLLDDRPIVSDSQIKFWSWVAFYYMCTMGEVYKAAMPAALKLESETYIFKNYDFIADNPLSPNEEKIFYALPDDCAIKVSEVSKLTRINNIAPYIKSLSEKDAISINEDIKNRYVAKTETMISLASAFSDEELSILYENLKRAKKQQQLFADFLSLRENAVSSEKFVISKKELLRQTGQSSAILDGLIERGILKKKSVETSRFNFGEANHENIKSLNQYQQEAYNEINGKFAEHSAVLLHGVTSSGKTEIYIRMIKDAIESGRQALYLLPEIALTTQITERLKNVFGDQLAVYHSKFSDNERAEVWKNLIGDNPKKVILGVRSSIFLPFQSLGLIIVDEEHETSYKQQEPAPRYNARDAALFLAHLHNAKTLLGTATPSIETYFNATTGKYGLVSLMKRHRDVQLPAIEVVNVRELRRKKQMKSILSPVLIDVMGNSLQKGEQSILFQNRRGFAPVIECKSCAWTLKCEHCDVSLTYHKIQNILLCHYCGATYSIPKLCPECKTENSLDIIGYGTERIEEEVSTVFPDEKVLRMDLDSTRGKHGYERIITDFAANRASILIGTQMVSKGLDFENVTVVGILSADAMLNYPDFRAHERAYQMMTQVSGRAGRKDKQGVVILQTTQPNSPIVQFVKEGNYLAMYNLQIEERKLFGYPPFYRIISITMRCKDDALLQRRSERLAFMLRQSFGDKILGPTRPSVSRVQTLYIRKIMIKIDSKLSPQKVRESIEAYKSMLLAEPDSKSLLIHFDVDPM
ncbi:primosomal protein N' [Dysgonomonas sp. 520]|uniref:replication restart helicase PriA n=1 Tax=Dysgonomonas sp. 520 TaxID=2302931 RepID=UPI0013D85766|nr:primosomal protein N' [Dysgonomonas sp. 520]NDW08487.1 primosomal protein N' [Dysgonomonas sp. 520]